MNGAEASEALPEESPRANAAPRPMWRRWLGPVIALALMALIATTVQRTDTLTVRWQDTADAEVWEGRLIGNWQSSPLEFVVHPDPTRAIGPAADLRRDGGRVRVARDPAPGLLVIEGPKPVVTEAPVSLTWTPGIPLVFRSMSGWAFLRALVLIALATLATIARWWILLRALKLGTPFWEAGRVIGVTLFFNVLLPGISGGDLARAVVVVRGHPERKADALVSVAADRVLGLLAMVTVAVGATWSSSVYTQLRIPVGLAFLALVGGLFVVVNPWLRKLVRIESLLARLPQGRRLGRLDAAVQVLARAPGAVFLAFLLSLANHGIQVAAISHLAMALGDTDLSFLSHLCVATVANTLSAVPISPGGLGVGEALFGTLFQWGGGSYTLGVATSITFRLGMVIAGLVGGLVLLSPRGRAMGAGYRALTRELDDGPDDGPEDMHSDGPKAGGEAGTDAPKS
mgnify:CR=1 FL=1